MRKRLFLLMLIATLVLSSLAAGGCQKTESQQPTVEKPTSGAKAELTTKPITLYFSDNQAMFLVPEEYTAKIAKNASQVLLLESAVKALIAGPSSKDLAATFPPETRLLGIEVKDGIAVVNFSEELKTKHWGGSAGEIMTLGSLTDTLTEFEGIQGVQLLLEGKVVDSLLGHMDTSGVLPRDETLIKK